MVKPKLEAMTVIDENWGEEYDDFSISIEIAVGPDGEKGSENFFFTVISPKRLESIIEINGIEFGRGLLIMKEYNYEKVKNRILLLLEKCKRDTWIGVATSIAKYARWEYDGEV